jgi:hypothetical protein
MTGRKGFTIMEEFQKIGRGLRRMPEQPKIVILDFETRSTDPIKRGYVPTMYETSTGQRFGRAYRPDIWHLMRSDPCDPWEIEP